MANDTTFPELLATMPSDAAFRATKLMIYAVAQIQALPDNRQELSDMLDACEIVRAANDPNLALILYGVEVHTGQEIDLWPAGEAYTEEELARRDAIRTEVDEMKAAFRATGRALDAPPSNVIGFD